MSSSRNFGFAVLVCLAFSAFIKTGVNGQGNENLPTSTVKSTNDIEGLDCDLNTCLNKKESQFSIGRDIRLVVCKLLRDARTSSLNRLSNRRQYVSERDISAVCTVNTKPTKVYFSESTACDFRSNGPPATLPFCKDGRDSFWDTNRFCYYVDTTTVLNKHPDTSQGVKDVYVEVICTYTLNEGAGQSPCDGKIYDGDTGVGSGPKCNYTTTAVPIIPPVSNPEEQLALLKDENIILWIVVPIAGILLLLGIISAIILLARRCWLSKQPSGAGGFGPWGANGKSDPWLNTLGSDPGMVVNGMDETLLKNSGLPGGLGGPGNPNMPGDVLSGAFPNMPAGGGAGAGNPNMPAEMLAGDFPNMPAGGGGGAPGNPNMPAEMMSGDFSNMPAGGGGGAPGNPNMPAEMMSGDFPSVPGGGAGGGAPGNPNMPADMMTAAGATMAAGAAAGAALGNPNQPGDSLSADFPSVAASGAGPAGNPNKPMDEMDASFNDLMYPNASTSGADITLDLYPQEETKMNPIFYE